MKERPSLIFGGVLFDMERWGIISRHRVADDDDRKGSDTHTHTHTQLAK